MNWLSESLKAPENISRWERKRVAHVCDVQHCTTANKEFINKCSETKLRIQVLFLLLLTYITNAFLYWILMLSTASYVTHSLFCSAKKVINQPPVCSPNVAILIAFMNNLSTITVEQFCYIHQLNEQFTVMDVNTMYSSGVWSKVAMEITLPQIKFSLLLWCHL